MMVYVLISIIIETNSTKRFLYVQVSVHGVSMGTWGDSYGRGPAWRGWPTFQHDQNIHDDGVGG